MPTVTTNRPVTIEELATALQEQLGSSYQITTRGSGPQEALKVKQSAASIANVHVDHNGDITTFHVHGGGLVLSRMLNEFGIAKKVSHAIEAGLAPAPPADTGDANKNEDEGNP